MRTSSYRAGEYGGNARLSARGRVAVTAITALLGCSPAPERGEAPGTPDAPDASAPQLPDTGALALAPVAASWRVRPIAHAPNYFELSGWKDDGTLFGRAGCNPVEVRVDEPEYVSWDVSACGGASLAPDGVRASWGDGRGAVLVSARGGAARTVRAAGAPSPSGEGDPTGLALWSPDGSRLLVSWAAEGPQSYAVANVETGAVDPVDARADGYFATDAWGWLDANRILFTLQAVRSRQGESEYREGGGYRGDLAVLDLRSGSFRTVTDVEDDVFLRPLSRWGEGAVLVGETRDGVAERYWIYDAGTWARRPVDLPAARVVVPADTSRIVFLGAEAGGAAPLILRDRGSAAPLATVRLRTPAVAWSPDGSRLALTGSFDDPLPGQPGSFVTRYAAYVIEPR